MQNLKPTQFSAVVDRPSAVTDVVDRVVTIAPAPLLPGEKQADYAEIALRIVKGAQPRDAVEEFLTRDVVDLTWEILRLRRMKAGLLRAGAGRGVHRILSTIGYSNFSGKERFAEEWAGGKDKTRQEFDEMLKKAGLTIDDVMAAAFAQQGIESFERLDRMLASAEARRNNALREIDRHREALGGAVRQAIDEVQDAEFRDVETGEVGGGAPA
jgi:hypothetical protein